MERVIAVTTKSKINLNTEAVERIEVKALPSRAQTNSNIECALNLVNSNIPKIWGTFRFRDNIVEGWVIKLRQDKPLIITNSFMGWLEPDQRIKEIVSFTYFVTSHVDSKGKRIYKII